MRRLQGFLIAALLALAPAAAGAGTLAFTGTLSITPFSSNFPTLTMSGSGTALVNGSGGGVHLASLALAGGTFGPVSTSIPLTAFATLNSVRFTGINNLTGNFTGISGGPPGGGPMALTGAGRLCLLFDLTCTIVNVPIPLSATSLGNVGFGLGGTQVITGPVNITMQNAPWTLAQPVLTIHNPGSSVTTPVLPGGFAHGAASGTSSTAANSGTVQLVTVTRAFSSLTAAFPEYAHVGVLNLHFVPEPGTLLLLGSGGAGLALLGRARRRRR